MDVILRINVKICHVLFCSKFSRLCFCQILVYSWESYHKITRNSSEDEIANVNFIYDDVVHTLQNTIETINSATDGRGYVLVHRFIKFSEITQRNGHYAVQGHL